MEDKLVSVIIPTYNRAEMLREAIKSVLCQTYDNFELLILDNCSPDHTPDVVALFSDSRIKYVRHQCNIGAMANWTYGVQWAQGKYLSILGDDDKYFPQFIQRRVNAMSKIPNAVAAFGQFDVLNVIDGSNGTIKLSYYESDNDSVVLYGKDALKASLDCQFVGASLYKSDIFRDCWNQNVIWNKCTDELINIKMAISTHNCLIYLNESDMQYRRHAMQDSYADGYMVAEHGRFIYEYLIAQCIDIEYKKLIKAKLIVHLNRNGKWLHEAGHYKKSTNYFFQELKYNPLNIKTIARILRSFYFQFKSPKICY
jgi:glycosyltransferase involved in cell wall biosynthesis